VGQSVTLVAGTIEKVRCGVLGTGWRGVIGCLSFKRHFPQKSHIISGSFAKNDLRLQASYESSQPWRVSGIWGERYLECRYIGYQVCGVECHSSGW